MFEPENDIERSLVRAYSEPAHRPDFLRQLLDAEVFLVLIPSGAGVQKASDGTMTLPKGTKLQLQSLRRGDQRFLPFFSAPSRVHAVFKSDHIVAPDKPRAIFQRYSDAQFVLNPGSDYGKDFLRDEADRLLRGDFGDGLTRTTIDAPMRILVAQPVDYPTELVAALSGLFKEIPAIDAAHLALIASPGDEAHLVIAMSITGDWDAVMEKLGPKLKNVLAADKRVDFMALAGSPLESHLRSNTQPFYVRRNSGG
jgi:hypothetical protein